MRIKLLLLLLFFPNLLAAQTTGGLFNLLNGTPIGSCTPGSATFDQSGSIIYICNSSRLWASASSGGGGGGGATFQVNGVATSSSTVINFLNSTATLGLTLTFTNPSAGDVQLGLSGTLADAGLANAYSGVGACAANQVVRALVRNTAPTCAALTSSYLPAAVMYNNAANTMAAAGTLDTSAQTGVNSFKIPVINGGTPTQDGAWITEAASHYPAFGSNGNTFRPAIAGGDIICTFNPAACQVHGLYGLLISATPTVDGSVLSYNSANTDLEWITLALTGSGTTGTFTKWTSPTVVGNSLCSETATALTCSHSAGASFTSLTITGIGDLVSQPNGDFANVSKQSATFVNADIHKFTDKNDVIKVRVDKSGNLDLTTGSLGQEAATAAGTYVVGDLACYTASNTVGSCPTATANLANVGVLLAKNGSLPVFSSTGTIPVNSNASASFTVNDVVCTDTTNAGKVIDNGTAACPALSTQVGAVAVTDSSVTSHRVTLNPGSGLVGGAGSLPGISAGTKFQYLTNDASIAKWDSSWKSVVISGADPTGVASSTTAINNTCSADGITVFFPPGTYLISTQITANHACTYKSFGRTAKLKRGAASFTMILATHADVAFEDLEIDGNDGTFTGSKNISISNTSRVTVRNCYIHNVDQGGVYASGSDHVSVVDNYIVTGANGDAVFMESNTTHFIVDHNFLDAHLETVTSPHTIAFHSTTSGQVVAHGVISNNDMVAPTPTTPGNGGFCIETGQFGVGTLSPVNLTISGNTCNLTAPVSGCFSIADTINSTFTGNVCNDNGFLMSNTGIEAVYDTGTSFTGNTVNTDGGTGGNSGFSINSSSNCTFTGNVINGFSNTNGIGFYVGSGGGAQFTISSIAEVSGTTATVTISTSATGALRIGHRIRIAGETPAGYNGDWTVTGQADATHFTFTTATAALGADSVHGTVSSLVTNNIIANNVIRFPVITFPMSGTSYGVFMQCNATGSACSNNTIKGNIFVGTSVSGIVGISITGSGTTDSNVVEGNQFINLATGITRNNGSNTQFINNIFTGTTTQVGGTAQTGEVLQGVGTFAQLPASAGNGSSWNCTDCNTTCTAGSSNGQICVRINAAWTH